MIFHVRIHAVTVLAVLQAADKSIDYHHQTVSGDIKGDNMILPVLLITDI